MADQVETVPLEIDDKALFSGAMETETRQEAAPERETEQPERPRDEHGRFAPKTEQEAPEKPVAAEQEATAQQPQQPTDDDKTGHVPSWRLREEREAREAASKRADEAAREAFAFRQQMQAMQQQLAKLQQPKQEPVDFYADPEGAFKQHLTPLEERQAQFESAMQFRLSRTMAIAEHGAAAVKEMEEAVRKASREGHPEIRLLSAQMDASDDPVSVAMNWHKRTKLLEETGGDLTSYRQKALDDALNDPAFLAKAMERARAQASGQQQPGTRPAINLPPSLNRAPGSGITAAELDANDMSDQALFKHAAPTRR